MSNATRSLVSVREFVRFCVTGVVATLGNAAAVAGVRGIFAYPKALIAGLLAGFAISFSMGKLFAFRSRSLSGTWGELARFFFVYAFGALIYWAVGMLVGLKLAPLLMPRQWAEMAGVAAGASVMMITSYMGHRWFTYARLRLAE